MVLVVSAFAKEIAPLQVYASQLPGSQLMQSRVGEITVAPDLAVAVTGIGKLNSYAALCEIIELVEPDCTIAVGIAGSPSAAVTVGDIVLSDEIIEYDTAFWLKKSRFRSLPGPISRRYRCDPMGAALLKDAAEGVSGKTVACGITATADILLDSGNAGLYGQLLQQEGVLAVDMEAFAMAAAAASAGIPFCNLRIISDTVSSGRGGLKGSLIARSAELLSEIVVTFLAMYRNPGK